MKLDRIAYLPEATVGRLMIDGCETLYTIERPWIAGRAPGGAPNVSCVPDGVYSLVRHARPNGDVCVALRNPSCGVYYSQEHVPAAGGRTLILIHSANYASELQGCIAPGLGLTVNENRLMVTASRQAMAIVLKAFQAGDTKLKIAPALGTGK